MNQEISKYYARTQKIDRLLRNLPEIALEELASKKDVESSTFLCTVYVLSLVKNALNPKILPEDEFDKHNEEILSANSYIKEHVDTAIAAARKALGY